MNEDEMKEKTHQHKPFSTSLFFAANFSDNDENRPPMRMRPTRFL